MPLPSSPDVSRLLASFGARCLTASERRAPYEVPERGEPGHCPAVLLAESEQDVQHLLELANTDAFGVVLSAGRTGLVEAQRPEGECVLSLERLKRVRRLERADGAACELTDCATPEQAADRLFAWWEEQGRPSLDGACAVVEAGVPVDALNQVLAPVGRMFPMEMGSTASASVGACIANASAGANAVCYGTAAHMAETLQGFWADASQANCAAAGVWTLPEPSKLAIDSTALPETWGLAGSQGAYGVITEARIGTRAIPQTREAVLLPAENMQQAMHMLARARAAFGHDIEEFEFMSRSSVELVQRHRSDVRLPFDRPPSLPYLMLMQLKSEQEDATLAERLYAFCSDTLGMDDEWIGYAPLAALKKVRHSITESSNLEMRAIGNGRLSFDTATPLDQFGPYLDALAQRIGQARPDAQLIAFGHAGVGGAHLHLIAGRAAPLTGDAAALTDLIFDVTQGCGGTFSAEHGVGPKWAAQFRKRIAPQRLEQIDARKQRHDPRGILSPRSFGFDLARRAR